MKMVRQLPVHLKKKLDAARTRGTSCSVALNSTVLAALARLPKRSEFVFAKPNGKPYHAVRGFRAACQRASLIGVPPHTLRHTFATRLVENSVDLRTVQELGGWATLSLIQRYGTSPQAGRRRPSRDP